MRVIEIGVDGRADVINMDSEQIAIPMYAVNQGEELPETMISSGSVDLSRYQTIVSPSGTVTIVVPDGEVEGQCKRITSGADQAVQVEPTTPRWGSGLADIVNSGDSILIQWTTTGWVLLEVDPFVNLDRG